MAGVFGIRFSRAASCAALVVLLAASLPLRAENSAQQTQAALLKAQGLLKQIAQQKALAEAELATLRGELAGTSKALANRESEAKARQAALAQAEAELGSAGRRNATLARDLERTQERLSKTTAKLREVANLYKATRATLAETTAARESLAAQLAATTRELADADKKNLALYEINQELLAQYHEKSAWDALRQREPVTGIGGVSLENHTQEVEDRMVEQLRDGNLEAAER